VHHAIQTIENDHQKFVSEIADSMDSEANMGLVPQWLDGCIACTDYQPLRDRNLGFFMPIRLLDVRKVG
jgi:hypothetical protein